MTRLTVCVAASLLLVAFAPGKAVSGVAADQADGFEDGTTQGWTTGQPDTNPNQPENIADGGPTGPGDHYLKISSNGEIFAPGSKLATFNRSQWAGDYLGAELTSISAGLKNLGDTPLEIRLQLEHLNGTRFLSSDGFSLPVDSGWQSATFGLGPDDLFRMQGTSDLDTVLGAVDKLWIFHNGNRAFPPPDIVAELGVDNLTAVPEPSTILMCLIGALMLLAYYRRRRTPG